MLITMLPEFAVHKMINNAQKTLLSLRTQSSPPDHHPVIRLHVPSKAFTILLSEYYPEQQEFLGLCDYDKGRIEIGTVKIAELEGLTEHQLVIDYQFVPSGSLMDYLKEGVRLGHIPFHIRM